MDWLDLMQWPALVVTVVAAWMVSANVRARRKTGFSVFLASNVLWVIWGLHVSAYALITLQFCLAFSNVHGILRNRD
jgi:hypothetical protein